MKISALRLFNVKRFAGRGVAIEGIGEGVNVLCAANEYGKSTSFEALHALFFQPHSGTPNDVKNLQPYSKGSPIVEADIATDAGRYRITKQYYSGRSARVTDLASGRIVAQADEAENFIAALIKGGTAGPAGLLWVRQGITGIEKRSRAEEDSEKQVRASLLESVQGEVEAVTGGRRMAAIIEMTQEALGKLVTATGRPKKDGRYAAEIEAVETLASREQRLSGEVEALRDALDERARLSKQLAEIDSGDEKFVRRQAVDKARALLETASMHAARLRAAQAERALAHERRDTAAQKLASFRDAFQRAGLLRPALLSAAEARHAALTHRQQTGQMVEAARVGLANAETAERDAQVLLSRIEAAQKAQQARAHLAGLEKQLAEADSARQAIETQEARLSLLAMPARTIEDVQALETDIVRLRAIEEAARPSVSIVYDEGAAHILMDGEDLLSGQERRYATQAQLAVPGIGTITLRTNRPVQTSKDLAAAQVKRSHILEKLGIADLAAALRRRDDIREAEAALREGRLGLSRLAPDGLPVLRESVTLARQAAAVETDDIGTTPDEARDAMAVAATTRIAASEVFRAHGQRLIAAIQSLADAEAALAGLKGEWQQIEAAIGPADNAADRQTALEKTMLDMGIALAATESVAQALQAGAIDLETAQAALQRAASVEEAAARETNRLQEKIAELNGKIGSKSDDSIEEKWRETADALTAARERVTAYEKEVATLQRLSSALEAARSKARDLYLRPVMAELRPLLGLLFEDVSITFDEKTLLPQTLRRNGLDEDVERLSGGMREQLSVLTRLAFARLLARDGRPAPVVLDDALVYSDDDRIVRMFEALHRQSRDQQIIVFSCRQRAFRDLGGHVLHMTDWTP